MKGSNEAEKAISMKGVMVIVYFDINKSYDSMWREGPLIKLHNMGIGGRMYNWTSYQIRHSVIKLERLSQMILIW